MDDDDADSGYRSYGPQILLPFTFVPVRSSLQFFSASVVLSSADKTYVPFANPDFECTSSSNQILATVALFVRSQN